MTASLDGAQRTALSNLIQKARSLLEADLASTLEGDFGIHQSDGRIEEADALSLNASQAAVRIDLLDIVAFLRSEGETEPAAVERLIREAAFTHVNRLVALRVAEGLGILPEAIGSGLASQGFRDFAEIAPASADEDWERFRLFVRICADELSSDVPALFDPRNPLLELEPSTTAFSELIESFVAADETIWSAPDALGWSYQFFNSAEERKEMRESSAPRNSRELAVRNQFFTPSYVVEFLVQNGLGAHLAASYPTLVDELPLLVEVPEPVPEAIDLREVSALDPACGSGHFLLGAYEVLEAAWRHAGVEAEDAAPDIVRSLWGIDIDPRATQIAQAAVILRARRHCRSPLPKPNVICAQSLPAGPETDDLIAALPPHVGRVVRAVADELVMAPVLGPLLKIEERLDREARDAFGTGQVEGTLSEGVSQEDAANVESLVLETLATIADQTTSTASQRLFAAEAHDAVRFVEAMSRRYTACLMNPPFGEPVAATKSYLKAAYPWVPTKDYNLLAVFVGRGLELVHNGGTCAAITSRAGLFQKTFERWRKEVVLGNDLRTLADLGHGVMEDALVEAAAYVVARSDDAGVSRVVRLLREPNRPEALRDAVQNSRTGEPDPRVFEIQTTDLHSIDGSPVSYWLDSEIRQLFANLPSLEGAAASVRQGLATGDDFRFVRAAWEVDPARITSGLSGSQSRPWVPFAKGGAYSPFWADTHLVLNWGADGRAIKDFDGSVIRNPQFYFKPGLTWTTRTASGFAARLYPSGCVFSNKGNCIFPNNDDELFAMQGLLSSRLTRAELAGLVAAGDEVTSGGAAKSYEVGLVQKLPWLTTEEAAAPTRRMALRRASMDESDELTHRFVSVMSNGRIDLLAQLEDSRLVDEAVLAAAGLSEAARLYIDQEVGCQPLDYPERSDLDPEISRLYQLPIAELIDELIASTGGSSAIANLTFVADRRVEVIAHGLQVSPVSVLRVVNREGIAEPGRTEQEADRYLSYVVGLAVGRWDITVVSHPHHGEVSQDLLAPPARFAPGFLLNGDGDPPTRTPEGYPLQLPPDGVLLDQEGHDWDIAARVRLAASALSGDQTTLDSALASVMKRPSLETYLRSSFYKSHLSRYSMSRRKAPIYWQLQVPSKAWGTWLYAPRLSREMLFAVVGETEQRQRLAEQRIATLQREYEHGGAGRSIAAVSKELDAEQKLSVELIAFRDEAERIANLGWEPDLDDGAVLNAAPLASLFPAWKDAAKYRKELKQGKHTWSTVSKYADQL